MSKILRFIRLPWHDRWNVLHTVLVELKTRLYYARVFGQVGQRCRIYKPILLSNPRFVFIGDDTLIRPGARIETLVVDAAHPPALVIGNNVNIEQNVHLICGNGIVIGDNVSIAPNCAMLDTKHPFNNIDADMKIGDQLEVGTDPIRIGQNTLVGFSCVILPNVQIGRNCVIGANSTVRRNIPDYCIAAGNPARIIMRYDFSAKSWIKTS